MILINLAKSKKETCSDINKAIKNLFQCLTEGLTRNTGGRCDDISAILWKMSQITHHGHYKYILLIGWYVSVKTSQTTLNQCTNNTDVNIATLPLQVTLTS